MAIFNHTQSVASDTWVIAHNLGENEVVVDTMIMDGGNLVKALPLEATHTDNNTLTLTFIGNQTGSVRIIA